MDMHRTIGHSTALFNNYGNVAPTEATNFTPLTENALVYAVKVPPRAFITGIDVLITDSIAIVETAVTVTITRGVNGEYPLVVQGVPILVVGASHYAEGHADLNPMRPYKYVGSAPGYTFNPITDTGVTLYCHLYGTASPGTHDARLIVYWERMSE